MKRHELMWAASKTVLLGIFSLLFLLPMFWMVTSALNSTNEVFAVDWHWLPSVWQWDNFAIVWTDPEVSMLNAYSNTAFITVISTVCQLMIASMAAFVLAKYDFPGGRFFFAVVTTALMFSGYVTGIPNYVIMSKLNMIDTYWALLLPAFAAPIGLFMMKQFMEGLPTALIEAAKIDGANVVQQFMNITLPYMIFVTTPQLITQFVGNINNFNVIYLLTGGGPSTEAYYQAGRTDILVTWLFTLTMSSQDYGLAASIGILVFIVCATLSLIISNYSKSMKDEEAFS